MKAGRFREDLFYRLNVVPIRVPALRERPEDVEPLVRTFVRRYAERYGMGGVDVEPALVEALRANAWPGNVRELENTVARLLALAPDERITLALWRSLSEGPSMSSTPAPASGDPGPGHPLRARRLSLTNSRPISPGRPARRRSHCRSHYRRPEPGRRDGCDRGGRPPAAL